MQAGTPGAIVRVQSPDGPRWAVRADDGGMRSLGTTLGALLALPLDAARRAVDTARAEGSVIDPGAGLLPPVDEQEVWAAGVTYRRSRDGRTEESTEPSIYDRVYTAERPELFFKSTAARVVTDGEDVGIRADSGWDVPEPELGLVVNRAGAVFGYVVGNDMSSRSIEGDNPLYLPQAKVYTRSCALGTQIVPVWAAPEGPWAVRLTVERDDEEVFTGSTTTAELARDLDALAGWLVLALDLPAGAVLLTGTGIVPGADFTLAAGDVVRIEVDGIGSLTNRVVVVGRRPETQETR
ncbi:fumarylacetoacetate hydrolase family protein [Isoptericola halotolerans]|uniref:2-dehydro-3-deoxy-D-arabinonate dehydratase n=1 Tax=Isoptericola halotolerans TaxID=300560 RepID=A0ABX2A7G5_9MICO|nr:fumarylacetoacetate hydrolase family protein [Isoptericola halotolerans]NOV97835.1 2-dehydro-3-deoxy-D-arabinonate dehydratase [Isoptericola halotolerans]